MTFVAELKRRNVFRVGIAYALMGWLLLQGADFGFDLIDAPNWVIQALSIVVVIGLPIALFFVVRNAVASKIGLQPSFPLSASAQSPKSHSEWMTVVICKVCLFSPPDPSISVNSHHTSPSPKTKARPHKTSFARQNPS